MNNGPVAGKTLIIILGPTAVGKTTVSIEIAKKLRTEIISADSRQFYRELRIGTACPSDEELKSVPHHFIRHLSIHDDYNVARFETDALEMAGKIFATHDIALMVGGSGLYIDAVCRGIDELPEPDMALRVKLKADYRLYGIDFLRSKLWDLDPEYYKTVDLSNPNRLARAIEVNMGTGRSFAELRTNKQKARDFAIIKVGLNLPRAVLHSRINSRVDRMIEQGILEEARANYSDRKLNGLNTVGYKELFSYLDGEMNLEEAVEKIKTNTRRFARRQITWFRRDPDIRWFHPSDMALILDYILSGKVKFH
jgi:tRNA dimethylallyltransferase